MIHQNIWDVKKEDLDYLILITSKKNPFKFKLTQFMLPQSIPRRNLTCDIKSNQIHTIVTCGDNNIAYVRSNRTRPS